jgi:hypothetical protein
MPPPASPTQDYVLDPKHLWAVEIIRRHFARGIEELCDPAFLNDRYAGFQRKDDPIYAELLRSMDDEPLARTFVSYWTVAHTLATRSRFWLEAAIAEIIIHQAKHFGRRATEVYSYALLSQGFPARRRTIAEIGEEELEHLADSSPWRAPLQRSALREIDLALQHFRRWRSPAFRSACAAGPDRPRPRLRPRRLADLATAHPRCCPGAHRERWSLTPSCRAHRRGAQPTLSRRAGSGGAGEMHAANR